MGLNTNATMGCIKRKFNKKAKPDLRQTLIVKGISYLYNSLKKCQDSYNFTVEVFKFSKISQIEK